MPFYLYQTELRAQDLVKRLKRNPYLRHACGYGSRAPCEAHFTQMKKRIERLMGEVSKRCKHKWMHWSTDVLRNILILVLVRYTNEALYEIFKYAYIHNEALT